MLRLTKDGIRWELQSDVAPLLDEILATPGRIVKKSPVASVVIHAAGGKNFYVKRYRHEAGGLRPLKFFFKRSQAQQEWETAQRLESLGVPVVRHVALGARWGWRGLLESVLITEGFYGQTLDELPGADPQKVLAFVNQLHERGVLQRDLHPQNLLMNPGTGELRLVDVYGVEIKNNLSTEERNGNLAYLRMTLPLPVSAEVEQLAAQMRKRHLADRSRRCFRHNRDFAPKNFGGLRWQTRLELLNADVNPIFDDPDAFLATHAKILKLGRSSTVGAANNLVLKRYNLRRLSNLAKDLFRPSKARRAFRKAYHLELAGIPTARIIATADVRRAGILLRSYLLMEEIRGAVDLGNWRGEPRAAMKLIAELLAKLHNEGFSHRDLKETNILFNDEGQVFLIDLEGLEFVNTMTPQRAMADLGRLCRGIQSRPQFSEADWLFLFETYCGLRGIAPKDLLTHFRK